MLRVQPSYLLLVIVVFLRGCAVTQTHAAAESAGTQDNAFQKGLIALSDGHLETALDELTSAEQAYPSDPHIRNFRGVTLVRLGKNDEAEAEYREAVRLDPRMEDAYRNLGLLEWTEHRLDAASKDLRHALALASGDSFAHHYLGRVLLDSKDYAPAIVELDRSSVAWPHDPDFLIEVATAYSALGKRDDEIRIIDRLLTKQLTGVQSIAVVDLLLSSGRSDPATRLLQGISEDQKGNDLWAQFDLARAYLVAQDYHNAAAQARHYLGLLDKGASPNDIAPAWSLLGIAEANLKNSDAAINAFRQAFRVQPGDEEYCLNLTRELMDLSQYDQAISTVQAGIVASPSSYALHLRLGAIYLASARYVDAEKTFRQLADANDPLPISSIGLAQVLLRTGHAEDAAAELASAEHRLGPSFLIAYFRGLALKQAGEREQAATEFTEAVRLNPSSAEAHRDLGSTLLALGRIDDAISELKQSFRLAPNDVRTRRILSRAYARSGDLKTARQTLYADTDPAIPITGLQGDFILPSWQYPPEVKRETSRP